MPMMITTAILEFLVIGSLWIAAILVALGICLDVPSLLPLPESSDVRVLLSLVSLPFAYLLGVIAQGVTWRSWYLKRHHYPALHEELHGPHGSEYQVIYEAMRIRRRPLTGLSSATEALSGGRQLGALLDLLRVELLHGERAELGRQYQVQFHLYRLLYGSIPPLLALSVLLLAAAILVLLHRGQGWAILLLGSSINLLAGCFAFQAAAHRRKRLWKYLRLGANTIFTNELAGPLAEPAER
jgi:hypothetical protein